MVDEAPQRDRSAVCRVQGLPISGQPVLADGRGSHAVTDVVVTTGESCRDHEDESGEMIAHNSIGPSNRLAQGRHVKGNADRFSVYLARDADLLAREDQARVLDHLAIRLE